MGFCVGGSLLAGGTPAPKGAGRFVINVSDTLPPRVIVLVVVLIIATDPASHTPTYTRLLSAAAAVESRKRVEKAGVLVPAIATPAGLYGMLGIQSTDSETDGGVVPPWPAGNGNTVVFTAFDGASITVTCGMTLHELEKTGSLHDVNW